MMEYDDGYCPFCRSEGSVQHYLGRTTFHNDLYRCHLCYETFDQNEKAQRETKNREGRRNKEEKETIIEDKKPKKTLSLWKKTLLITMILFFIGLF